MAPHERFNFKTLEDLSNKISELGCGIKLSDDLSPLGAPVPVAGKTAPNAIAVLPLEGCDSARDGSPTELVERRYLRFASGGAGLLWWEACAVVSEGRANPYQMMITKENAGKFEALLKKSVASAANANGSSHVPVNILQLTHSGRLCRPEGRKPLPVITHHDPFMDLRSGIDESYPVATDSYLESLVEKYVQSALLAREAGFDGVDIKACNRYLLSELLAGFTRGGKYGGSFENRTRLMLDIIKAVRKAAGEDFIVASRFNVYDAHPYPYGFGAKAEDKSMEYDSSEPLKLVKLLIESGARLLGTSAGNPFPVCPQTTRLFDRPCEREPIPDEHPLESIARLFEFTKSMQKAAGSVPVVGLGYTWLRQFLPYAGAANLSSGGCRFVGLARSSLAYPDAPKDILSGRGMDSKKVCVTCSKCTQIMRDHGRVGCVIRDFQVYSPIFAEFCQSHKV